MAGAVAVSTHQAGTALKPVCDIAVMRKPFERARFEAAVKLHWYHYLLVDTASFDLPPTDAMREFVWKGQMSYQVALRFDIREGALAIGDFHPRDAAPLLTRGPAHYSAVEIADLWDQVKSRWDYSASTVTLFEDTTLVNATPANQVNLNDLVPVNEFGCAASTYRYVTQSSNTSWAPRPLVRAQNAGDAIGLKVFWDDLVAKGGSAYNRPAVVPWGLNYYNISTNEWEPLRDIESELKATVQVNIAAPVDPLITKRDVLELNVIAPAAGIYQFIVGGGGGDGASVVDLNWNVAADTASGLGPRMTYSYAAPGMKKDDYWYFYIPKSTSTLDFETWSANGGRTLVIYQNTATPGTVVSRTMTDDDNHLDSKTLADIGMHHVALLPAEKGGVIRVYKPHVPYMYSIPMLWAKSLSHLMVPSMVAAADGLTPRTTACPP